MKKTLSNFGLVASLFLPAVSVVSCSTSPTVNSNFDSAKWVEKFSTESIVREESFDNIVNRIQKANFLKENVTEKEFEENFKEILSQELIIDKESQIYEEIVAQNKLSEFEASYVDEAYKGLIEEIKEEQSTGSPNARHWVGFFNRHSWQTVRWCVAVFSVNVLLPVIDIGIQFGPAIVSAYKGNFEPLLRKLATFKGFTKITKSIVTATIAGLRDWKIRTKCKSSFVVWGTLIYEVE